LFPILYINTLQKKFQPGTKNFFIFFVGTYHDTVPSTRKRMEIIKSFCWESRGTVFSKRVPLAAGGKRNFTVGLIIFFQTVKIAPGLKIFLGR